MGNHFGFLHEFLQGFEQKSIISGTDDNDILWQLVAVHAMAHGHVRRIKRRNVLAQYREKA
jgi:hypothetical protein